MYEPRLAAMTREKQAKIPLLLFSPMALLLAKNLHWHKKHIDWLRDEIPWMSSHPPITWALYILARQCKDISYLHLSFVSCLPLHLMNVFHHSLQLTAHWLFFFKFLASPGCLGDLTKVPFTVRQWELSPPQTPHLSSCFREPISLSQPTCCH